MGAQSCSDRQPNPGEPAQAAVVVVTTQRMVLGAVDYNERSVAGSSERQNVNQLTVQPFLN